MTEETPKKTRFTEIFNSDPALKKEVEDFLDKIPAEEKKKNLEKCLKFIAGDLTWAEVKGYPKSLLREIARIAHNRMLVGDLKRAEIIFKGLSVLDHKNWYFRAALGAIYQRQKLFDQAIEEYSMALMLNENEITSYTNRAECYIQLKDLNKAQEDLNKAILLDPDNKNAWGRRARALKEHIKGANKG